MKRIMVVLMFFICSFCVTAHRAVASDLTLPYTLPAVINGVLYTDVLAVPSGDNWKVIYYTNDGNPYAYADVGEVLKDSQNDRNPPVHRAYFYCPSDTCSSTPTDTTTYVVTSDWSSCFSQYQTSKHLKQDGAYNYAGYKCGLYNIADQTILQGANVSRSTTFQFPLSGSIGDRTILLEFGVDWIAYCNGLIKKHAGIDISASEDETVYAANSGTVRVAQADQDWGGWVTIEHNGYTTLYLHITPSVSVNDAVNKGDAIGNIVNYGGAIHLHFGFRLGNYSNTANRGALPQTVCDGDPAFPENFLNPRIILPE